MASVKIKVPPAYTKRVFGRPVQREMQRGLRRRMVPMIAAANSRLLREFLRHDITQEILAGNIAQNTSFTLNGYGNLFSFLGFEAGDDPVERVVRFLSRRIKIRTVETTRGSFSVMIYLYVPDRQDLEAEVSMYLPWADTNWVLAIEDGVSGLGEYLFSEEGFDVSRSDTGIQLKNLRRSLRKEMVGQKYLTDIIRRISKELVARMKTRLMS